MRRLTDNLTALALLTVSILLVVLSGVSVGQKAPYSTLIGNTVDVKILAPAKVQAGAVFVIQVQLPEEARSSARFDLDPEPAIPPLELLTKTGDPVFLVNGITERTVVTVFVQIESPGLDPIGWQTHAIDVRGSPEPKPDPGPEPDPDPKPQPSGPYWLIFLEESGERSVDMARILGDVTFFNGLNQAGHKWRVYDDDATGAKPYASLTTHRPALILTEMNGKIVSVQKLPSSTEVIQELIDGGAK